MATSDDELTGREPQHTAPPDAAAPPAAAPAPRARGGRLLGVLALLVALLAAALAGWPWYGHLLPVQLPHPPLYQPPPPPEPSVERADLERATDAVRADATRGIEALASSLRDAEQRFARQLESLATTDSATAGDLAALERQVAGALEALQQQTQAELDALEQRVSTELADAVDAAARAAAPGRVDWRLAEAEFLLRAANHRLALEHNPQLAQQMLGAADRVLAELDEPGLRAVRARIADERALLGRVPTPDRDGLFLEIEALKPALDELPLRTPEFVAARGPTAGGARPDAATGDQSGFWPTLTARMGRLFEFRRHDGDPARPLLAPDQALYLEMNLRLMLERAQLALLRGDGAAFAASVTTARAWLHEHVDPRHPRVRQVAAALEDFATIEFPTELPEISAALDALLAYRAQRGDAAPRTPVAPVDAPGDGT
jgi:uroporphyrin-III C-methyltransferase